MEGAKIPTAQIWTGSGSTSPELDTITIASATSADTYIFSTPNGKSVTYTAGVSDTTATIAAGLYALCAASTEPEFAEQTFAYTSGATFTATGPADGAPLSNSVGGTGGISIAVTTAALSPHDYSRGANWLSGSAPGAGDSVTFDGTSTVPCKYNLGYAVSTSLTSWTRKATFPGPVGLSTENPAAYLEFRQTYVEVDSTNIVIQQAQSDSAPTIRVKGTSSSATTVTIIGTGQGFGSFSSQTTTDYTIEVYGLPASSVIDAVNANVGICPLAGQTCTLQTLLLSNCTGYVGPGTILVNPTVSAGNMEIDASYTTLTINQGGTVVVGGAATPATGNVVTNGTLQWQSTGALNATTIGALGTLDMSLAPAAIATGTITMLPGATLNDPVNRLTRSYTISAENAQMSELNLNIGTGFTLTVAT